jgi:hypothetical protein
MTKYTFSNDLISDLHKDAWGHRPSNLFMLYGICIQMIKSNLYGMVLLTIWLLTIKQNTNQKRQCFKFVFEN